jgi:hypothetical protein
MIIKTLFTKDFSHINGIQRARTIDYNMCESDSAVGKVFGVNISESGFGHQKENMVAKISLSRIYTENIIKFLYENGVDALQLQDVLEDLENRRRTGEPRKN